MSSGGWIRTPDLRVMSPTSCHCSTPHRDKHYRRILAFVKGKSTKAEVRSEAQGVSSREYGVDVMFAGARVRAHHAARKCDARKAAKPPARADSGRDSVKGFGPAERIGSGCFRSSTSGSLSHPPARGCALCWVILEVAALLLTPPQDQLRSITFPATMSKKVPSPRKQEATWQPHNDPQPSTQRGQTGI